MREGCWQVELAELLPSLADGLDSCDGPRGGVSVLDLVGAGKDFPVRIAFAGEHLQRHVFLPEAAIHDGDLVVADAVGRSEATAVEGEQATKRMLVVGVRKLRTGFERVSDEGTRWMTIE